MTSKRDSLPFSFKALETTNPLLKDFSGYEKLLSRVIPGNWLVQHDFEESYASEIYNLELRDDDVWIITYPKSGTTWMQCILWLLLNDYEFPENQHLDDVSPHLELTQGMSKKWIRSLLSSKYHDLEEGDPLRAYAKEFLENLDQTPIDLANNLPANKRRLIKSHLPFALLPPKILERNKVVFVARDPRDILISYYHHMSLMKDSNFTGEFKDFFKYFICDEVVPGPYWEYMKQAYQYVDHPNVIYVHFSDMKQDLHNVIHDVVGFLDLQVANDDVQNILEKVSIESMRNNLSVDNSKIMIQLGLFNENKGTFIREGKIGGWKNILTKEMKDKMDKWTKKSTIGTNLPLEKLYRH